jgi:hypothetical protein
MAKYIIEIEDVPSMLEDGLAFYKCVDAPWWYISDMNINRLKPYEDAEEVAQPDLQPTCNQLATDCISRQEAIDAVTPHDDEYRIRNAARK